MNGSRILIINPSGVQPPPHLRCSSAVREKVMSLFCLLVSSKEQLHHPPLSVSKWVSSKSSRLLQQELSASCPSAQLANSTLWHEWKEHKVQTVHWRCHLIQHGSLWDKVMLVLYLYMDAQVLKIFYWYAWITEVSYSHLFNVWTETLLHASWSEVFQI